LVIVRQRHNHVVAAKNAAFYHFIEEHLLPVQQRHGVLLIGRSQTADGV
jgi:hypothetical protein